MGERFFKKANRLAFVVRCGGIRPQANRQFGGNLGGGISLKDV